MVFAPWGMIPVWSSLTACANEGVLFSSHSVEWTTDISLAQNQCFLDTAGSGSQRKLFMS